MSSSGRRVLIGAVALGALTLVAAGQTGAARAGTCTVDVPEGDATALQTALTPPDPALGCADWTVRVSGTTTLTGALTWTPTLPLRLVGPEGGMARIEADSTPGGHRLLTVATVASPAPVTLERLVLAGGDVSTASGIGADEGGAVYADTLVLVDVELVGNRAKVGGAVSVVDLTAIRTSFVGNDAVAGSLAAGTGLGGAVFAEGDVTLTNVTFLDNAALSGGALHLDPFVASATLDATFVTLLGSAATVAGEGSHLHLEGEVTTVLRGVLLGPLAVASDTRVGAAGPACAGSAVTAARITREHTLATDRSCEGAGDTSAVPAIAGLGFDTVAFRTAPGAGTTALPVPAGAWPGLDAITCDGSAGAWPATDQRGLARPQPAGGACDVGAVERAAVVVPPEDDPPVDPPVDPQGDPDVGSVGDPDVGSVGDPSAVVVGPVPRSVPAGDGACADGCP